MNGEKNLTTVGAAAVECRKKTTQIAGECIIVLVVCFVIAGLAWGFLVGLPVLRIICLITFAAGAGGLITTLAKNPPWLVLSDNILRARCYPLGAYGEMGKARELVTHLEDLERVWVGKPRDYPSDLLMNHTDTRTFPCEITMVIWLRSENNPYLVREFSWLSRTSEFLKHLRALGIRVEFG